jgi:hypothetical protein
LHRAYPSQHDGGQAFTLGLQVSMADNLNVSVDATARADTELKAAEQAHESALEALLRAPQDHRRGGGAGTQQCT